MRSGRFVFSQIMEHLSSKAFRRCVRRYGGDRHIQSFTCLDQFLCLAFARLTHRESLRAHPIKRPSVIGRYSSAC